MGKRARGSGRHLKGTQVPVTLCTKNDPEDVEAAFAHHGQMPSRMCHLIATRSNWGPKSTNLRSLARELDRLGTRTGHEFCGGPVRNLMHEKPGRLEAENGAQGRSVDWHYAAYGLSRIPDLVARMGRSDD